MPATNQVMVDNVKGMVMVRSALQTADDTAIFECLQKFTPKEADQFADALRAGAVKARKVANKIAKDKDKSLADGKAETKKKRAKSKASKKGNR